MQTVVLEMCALWLLDFGTTGGGRYQLEVWAD
jgi:hypothetical protein